MECPNCGYMMDAFTVECPRCKKRRSQASAVKAATQPVKSPSPAARPVVIRCQLCGRELPVGAQDCPECAAAVKTHEMPQPTLPLMYQTPQPGVPASFRMLKALLIVFLLVASAGSYWYLFYGRKGILHGEVFVVTRGRDNIKLGLVTVRVYPLISLSNHIAKQRVNAEKEMSNRQAKIDAAQNEMQRAKTELDQRKAAEDAAFKSYMSIPLFGSYEEIDSYNAAKDQASSVWHQRQNERLQAERAYDAAEAAYYSILEESDQYKSGDYYFASLPKPLLVVKTNGDGNFDIALPIRGQFVVCAETERAVFGEDEHYYWMVKASLDGKGKKTIFLSNDNMTDSGSPDSLIETD